mmetsp:Transcript_40121/g.92180  ORF Transcript_40121/g.92180 Transcript_40121/m.92180 type:complete len:249 (-) Transcript_40121:7-753(-)
MRRCPKSLRRGSSTALFRYRQVRSQMPAILTLTYIPWKPISWMPLAMRTFTSSTAFACSSCPELQTSFSFQCPACGELMKADYGCVTHYDVLGVDTKFEVSRAEVDAAFKKLQMRLHPDRFAQASAEVEALAQLHSAKLNEAARTLRSPLLRGRYWMQLKGVRVLEEDQRMDDMATMMEIMEEGEKLEEATTQATVDELTADNEARIEKTEASLAQCLAEEDWLKSREKLERLQMIMRLHERLNEWKP